MIPGINESSDSGKEKEISETVINELTILKNDDSTTNEDIRTYLTMKKLDPNDPRFSAYYK